MDKDAYIKQLEAENAALKQQVATMAAYIKKLEQRIEELERRLGLNSQNSSKPPSSDPPGTVAPAPALRRRRRKRGARKGHEPHFRSLLPPDKVTRTIPVVPQCCSRCGSTHLDATPGEMRRHQIIDLPPVLPEVREYQQLPYRCGDCGAEIYQSLPDAVKRQFFGPGLLALVGILTGMLNVSKRKALALINEYFGVPLSLGGLIACEAQLAQALEKPHQEVHEFVQAQQTSHADETGWPRGNRQGGWLWVLACTTAAVFLIQAKRGQAAAQKLLGRFAGVLHCDRWSGYNLYAGLRQLCWAHLKRDFAALSELAGPMGRIGKELLLLSKEILHLRKRVREGTLRWETFQQRLAPLMPRVEKLLAQGAASGAPLAGRCRRIHNLRAHLWTFVHDSRVEPTNNLAERMVRQAVLWRKGSFGTQSERGARYAERILTASATCRLQGRSIIEYLRAACHCHLKGLPVPSLLKVAPVLAKTA